MKPDLELHEREVQMTLDSVSLKGTLGLVPGATGLVLFVHGSVSTHTDWMRVAKLLAPRYTCYTIARRGRAHSGNGRSPYSLEREYEDIAAVRN